MSQPTKPDIRRRYGTRAQAEHYRDRFRRGRRRRTHEREAGALATLLRMLPDVRTVLDVGSGPGRFVPVFLGHVARLIQLDLSKHMLDVSREQHRLEPSRGAYVQADICSLPFAANSVDMVFCHRLLNHLPEASQRVPALEQLAQVSRRYVVVSCLSSPRLLRIVRRLGDGLRRRRSADSHVALADLLREASAIGLTLEHRIPLRAFFRSAAFLVFRK